MARAKTICRPCVHIVACLEYALTVPVENGRWVEGCWGATTTDERAEILSFGLAVTQSTQLPVQKYD